MKITQEQWHELHASLKWKVERDTRWETGLRVRYWQNASGLAVKEVFSAPGQNFYEILQSEVIPHSHAYDVSVAGTPQATT